MTDKHETPSFVLEVKLNTTKRDEKVLNDRFFAAFLMTNRLVSHARKCIASIRQDPSYWSLLEKRRAAKAIVDSYKKNDKKTSKKLSAAEKRRLKTARARLKKANDALATLRRDYGLSEYQFHAWIKVQQHRYGAFIDSNTAQKQATRVWKATSDTLFNKGKTIHFKRLDSLESLEGKSTASGIRLRDGRLVWKGLSIQPQWGPSDAYETEALTHRLKYCRIVRRAMGTSYHYYLQLVLEGLPPQKHLILPDGRVGIDQGTLTEAIASERGCLIVETSATDPKLEKASQRIQRRMDRSLRATNPDAYNADGTMKRRHKRLERSKHYRKDRMRLKTLYGKASRSRKQRAEETANLILSSYGSDIVTEKMDYKALQKKAKADPSKPAKRRKRFGKSIQQAAPAAFMRCVKRKVGYVGKEVFEVDATAFKASQLHHDTKQYVKDPLSARSKAIAGKLVQRDLYSAFLLMCAKDRDGPDFEAANRLFPSFHKAMEDELLRLLLEPGKLPSSIGLKDFSYLLNQ